MCTLCQSLSPTTDYLMHRDLATSPGEVVFPVSVTQEATITETTDAAASTATIYSLGDNDVFSGSVDFVGDVDWIEVSLADGAALAVQQDNISLGGTNTFIELYAADGTTVLASESYYDFDESALVYYNDTGSAQTVYIAATSFNGGTGDYQVTALIQEYDTGSAAEIAEFLTNAWFGTEVAYDVAPGDTIRVDITDLDADEAALALDALEAWTLVTGINFAAEDFDVTGNTGITFVNDVNGDPNVFAAFAGPDSVSNNVISGSTVTVTSAWVDAYGTGYDEYSFLTYMHEIGHALGLVHGGPYDGSATYSTTPGGDNVFVNDSYLMTIMSYFSLDQVSGDFTDYYLPVTPMIADILAVQDLYGVAGTLRTDDTTYGYGSTVGGQYDDFINLTGPIGWTIIDDGGVDTIDFTTVTESMTIDLTPGAVSSVGGGTNNMVIFDTTVIENLILDAGNDTVVGNDANNRIKSGDGNDTVTGNDGDDRLITQNGADVIDAGIGDDYVSAGSGNDSAVGGQGNDLIYGSAGMDELDGGAGNDSVFGGTENDTIHGDIGDDYLIGQDGDDLIYGGADQDLAIAGGGNDTIYGGTELDTIYAQAGNDTIFGGDGNDVITGKYGDDLIHGDAGDDNIFAGFESDTVYGGDGNDTLRGEGQNDTVYGGNNNDVITGGTGRDVLHGDSGTDTIYGQGGADTLYGGTEADFLYGGASNDDLSGGGGDDLLSGGDGNDTLNGGAGNDSLFGNGGADVFVFDSTAFGQDEIRGWQDGLDLIDVTTLGGMTFGDFTITQSGADTVISLDSDPTQTITLVNVTATTIDATDFV